jgi:hypothetical protein
MKPCEARQYIHEHYGKDYIPATTPIESEGSQEAHEASTTSVLRTPDR